MCDVFLCVCFVCVAMSSPLYDESIWDVFYADEKPRVDSEPIDTYTCSNCKKSGYISFSVCTNCGYDTGNYITSEAEWVSCVSDGVVKDDCRVGMPKNPLFSSNSGIGTVISTNGRHRSKYSLAARINYHSSINHVDRALYKAYCEFDDAGARLRVSKNVIDAAKFHYKKFSETTLTRGAVRAGVKANCLFWACKDNNCARSTQEVADAFEISSNDMSRTYDMARDVICPQKNEIMTAGDLIPRILNNLNICTLDKKFGRLKMTCIRFGKMLSEYPTLMSKTPAAIASVSILRVFAESEYEITKDDIAEAAGISKTTISKIDSIVKGLLGK